MHNGELILRKCFAFSTTILHSQFLILNYKKVVFMDKYDVIIIGAGPAGLTAAIYCGRSEFKTLVLEKMSPGGQMATTSEIENYPGFPNGVDGPTLAFDMLKQAQNFGVDVKYKEVTGIEDLGDEKIVTVKSGDQFSAKAIILAMGASPRLLGVDGENKFRGRGVSYCATCDGAFFRGKTVVVVGGGDTAAEEARFLSTICEKVYLIHRRDTLRAAKIYMTKLEKCENVEFVWNSTVEEILGEQKVTALRVKDKISGEEKEIATDGVFVAVGTDPQTELVRGFVDLDERNFIIADETTKTNVEGVFVAGDTRTKVLRQVSTSVSDGAVASYMVQEFVYN